MHLPKYIFQYFRPFLVTSNDFDLLHNLLCKVKWHVECKHGSVGASFAYHTALSLLQCVTTTYTTPVLSFKTLQNVNFSPLFGWRGATQRSSTQYFVFFSPFICFLWGIAVIFILWAFPPIPNADRFLCAHFSRIDNDYFTIFHSVLRLFSLITGEEMNL